MLAALRKNRPDIELPMQVFALKSFANTNRLLTAIELGVPFSRISNFTGINMDAAIRVLQKHFPYVTREFLAQCADEYLVSWCQETPPSENSTPHAESQEDESPTETQASASLHDTLLA